jgi:hypothetical protein
MKTAEEFFESTPNGYRVRTNNQRGKETVFTKSDMISFAESFAKESMKYAHPDTEADGYVFCGKCGKMKG